MAELFLEEARDYGDADAEVVFVFLPSWTAVAPEIAWEDPDEWAECPADEPLPFGLVVTADAAEGLPGRARSRSSGGSFPTRSAGWRPRARSSDTGLLPGDPVQVGRSIPIYRPTAACGPMGGTLACG
ncbi:hypothetical protein JYK14_24600 [Siccirubricoccus sp. KC 17139]|uniref:Uncharacterized protein n=1 Tax=Siccirubricoccus soli TaxID=2899147 RepID=A0ABT1DBJ9_9PROT|nr:hypothetical protein [Siccirubricoccus soli]MCO6419316.1 hypothetical protein [Siccirubricoccus soli]MCP2685451.1 hypothetical protein [Siccirubricoccus soli]